MPTTLTMPTRQALAQITAEVVAGGAMAALVEMALADAAKALKDGEMTEDALHAIIASMRAKLTVALDEYNKVAR